MPHHAGVQLPRDVHAAVAAQRHAAVVHRRHFRRQQRHHPHPLVRRRQPFDDADLDVLENVRAEAVQGIGLAIVTDDQEIVGRRVRSGAAAAADGGNPGEHREHGAQCTAATNSHHQMRSRSGTGIEPNDSTRS